MIYKQTESHKGDILIVDDDLPSLSTLSSMLTTEGYEVRGVPDGKMALTVIENRPPELILLDVKMPGMDGFEVCQQIKADEKSSDIPIIFLSALDEVTDKVKGFESRAVDFITKPFQAEEVLARVDAHITLNRLSRNLEEQIEKRTVELRESEERFRAFMDNSPFLAYIKNKSGKHVYVNKTLCDVFEITPDQFIGTATKDFFPEKVAKRIEGYDDEVRKKGITLEADDYSAEVKEQVRWWKEIKFPINFPSGEKMVGGVVFDITTRKRGELKLKKAYEEIKQLRDMLEQENISLREEIEVNYRHGEIVGESSAIKGVLHQAEKVSGQSTSVLILGETGTGKELVARAIHKMSPRHGRQMITVNCAALPSNLIESELFGREKGAFTGALTKQIGRFEAAHGSTIFLDEIGDLSVGLQAKLLRMLQDGQFERLGSPETVHVDVRVLAATNHDLKTLVQEGRFRKDLYYRLNVFPIEIPPLRERREDIPLLVWAFIKEFEESMGKSIRRVPQKSMDFLQNYSWPGNVRELRNVIERAMILSTDAYLDIPDTETEVETAAEDLILEDVQRKHIVNVLEKTGWRIRGKRGAATLLEIKPTTLEARIKKLRIERTQ